MDVAEPSFRIWKLSMSSALRPAMEELMRVSTSPVARASALTSTASSMMTPSTTHSGLLLPKMEVAPRTRILGAVPKVPLTFCTDTPAARPSSERLMSAMPSIFIFSASICTVAPEKRRLSIFCIPVTTTSCRSWLSGWRVTLMPVPMATVCLTNPM